MDLTLIPDNDLHAEIERRRKAKAHEEYERIQREHGPCKVCGGPITSIATEAIEEIWSAGDEPYAWMVPGGASSRKLIGVRYLTTFKCERGDEWTKEDLKMKENT